MDLYKHPELLDKLSASYAIGTLKPGARRRLESYAKQNASIRTSMTLWQERLSAMTELAAPVEPRSTVWSNIERRLQLEARQQQALGLLTSLQAQLRKWKNISWVGFGCAATASLMLAFAWQSKQTLDNQNRQLEAALKASPEVRYIAVLNDDKSAANVLVTFDRKTNQVNVQRVGEFKETNDKSLQLWAIPKAGAPTSVSVLSGETMMKVATNQQLIEGAVVLAVSLEAKGGVPSEKGPQGPVLFKGQLIQNNM